MTPPVVPLRLRQRIPSELLRFVLMLMRHPSAAAARIPRLIGVIRARYLFRRCRRGSLIVALGHVAVRTDGNIVIGDRVQFAGGMLPTRLVAATGATLRIGAETLLSYGAAIEASMGIEIGARCQIASQVMIRDCNERTSGQVRIGDDVWVAYGAIIEPGVVIGHNSVIAAGSVVTSDVPAYSLATGNPAVAVPLRGAPDGT